jgi:hypothetical protein
MSTTNEAHSCVYMEQGLKEILRMELGEDIPSPLQHKESREDIPKHHYKELREDVPSHLQHKISALRRYCNDSLVTQYRREQTVLGLDAKSNSKTATVASAAVATTNDHAKEPVQVSEWEREKHALVFYLSDQSTQYFFHDGSMIILSFNALLMIYVSKRGLRATFKVADIFEAKGVDEIRERLIDEIRERLNYAISHSLSKYSLSSSASQKHRRGSNVSSIEDIGIPQPTAVTATTSTLSNLIAL